MKHILLAGLVAVCTATLHPSSLSAGSLALTDFSGGSVVAADDTTWGWEFIPAIDITVEALGYFDTGGDGLIENHQVGLWQEDGTLLGSTVVLSGTNSAAQGGVVAGGVFRFESIAQLDLTGGQKYVIGGYWNQNDDPVAFPTSLTVNSLIGGVADRGISPSSGFTFPNLSQTSGGGGARGPNIGPNFIFTTTVPEPSTFALLGIGGLALVGYGWRRKRQQAA